VAGKVANWWRDQALLPRGSQVVMRGQVETMQSSFIGLGVGLAMAIVLVYLLIVVNFQSIDAAIIITALPAALAGIAWMLFITGTTLGAGPDRRHHDHGRGHGQQHPDRRLCPAAPARTARPPLAAALEAGTTRMRPVLMTALAMIIGMMPMALGLGEGAEQNAPLGRAVIGACCWPPYRPCSSCRWCSPVCISGWPAAPKGDVIWRAGPHIRSLEPCRMTVIPNSASTLSARASRNSASR
jgi:hypothetical protein